MKGQVENLITERGFGFLRGEDGQRYFFHISAVVKVPNKFFADLCLGDAVALRPTTGQRGPRADEVEVV